MSFRIEKWVHYHKLILVTSEFSGEVSTNYLITLKFRTMPSRKMEVGQER